MKTLALFLLWADGDGTVCVIYLLEGAAGVFVPCVEGAGSGRKSLCTSPNIVLEGFIGAPPTAFSLVPTECILVVLCLIVLMLLLALVCPVSSWCWAVIICF